MNGVTKYETTWIHPSPFDSLVNLKIKGNENHYYFISSVPRNYQTVEPEYRDFNTMLLVNGL